MFARTRYGTQSVNGTQSEDVALMLIVTSEYAHDQLPASRNAMSPRRYAPSKLIASAVAYARSRAAAIVSPRPTQVRTRPPAVTVSVPRRVVPAWKTTP